MLRPAGVLEDMVWNIPNVSVPLGIGLCWVFPFEIWRCGCVEMMRGIGGAQRPMLICIILH